MKITYFILLTFLFSGVSNLSHAQEPIFSAELPEVREIFVGASNDKMIYYKEDVNLITNSKIVEYIVVNTANPEEKKMTVKSKPEFSKTTRIVFDRMFVQGDFVYEIHEIYDYNSVIGVGIVKRELATLKQVGEVLELNDYDATFAKSDGEGFYFFSKTNLYRIDLDLNVIWTKKYEMFEDYSVRLSAIEVDDNQNVLMTVSVDAKVKTKFFGSTPPSKSSLLFIITDIIGGDPKVISPEIPESITVQAARFNYDEKSKQLKGLFITATEPNSNPESYLSKGIGYTFIKWDDEGSVVSHEKHNFSFTDFLDEGMQKCLQTIGLKSEKCDLDRWLAYQGFSNIRFLKNGNVFFIATSMGKYNGELENSKMMFVLSPEGKMIWQKMLPYSSNGIYRNTDFYIADNKVHLLIQDFTKSFETGKYIYNIINSPANGKTICLSERVLDLETGNELSDKSFANPTDKFMPTAVIYNKNNKVIVRYSFTAKNREQFLSINY
ncbi:hypothetical protein [Fluviicola sp.]|uniref:hypothetical protein n=1 Tax=Fluviicola sp. TaxID=1917219 RepID=UPI003D2C8B07